MERLRDLLHGSVGHVITGLRRRLSRGKLSGPKKLVVRSAVEYLANNRGHMRYDEYLAAGYPSGSGVAEGAYRHLVEDRLEQTGMRCTVEGAQAMLHVRALYLKDSGMRSSNSGPNESKPGYIDQLRHSGRRITPVRFGPLLAATHAASTGKARMHYTAVDDGLSLPWHGTVFVNPPYGRQLPAWIAKAHAELGHGNARLVVALIPARTDTSYWHRHVAGHADVYFLKGRLRYGQNGQSAPSPSALAVWGADAVTLAKLDAAFPEAWRMGRG